VQLFQLVRVSPNFNFFYVLSILPCKHMNLFLQVSEGTLEDSTLVWTLGEEDVPDDYEDVRVEVLNKIFSASTQFDEPRATNEVMDAEEAVRIVGEIDK